MSCAISIEEVKKAYPHPRSSIRGGDVFGIKEETVCKTRYCVLGALAMYATDKKLIAWPAHLGGADSMFPDSDEGTALLMWLNPGLAKDDAEQFAEQVIELNDVQKDFDGAWQSAADALVWRTGVGDGYADLAGEGQGAVSGTDSSGQS